MSILPLTIPPKKLAQTISSAATSFKLNNVQGWGGVDLTPSDFGTEAYGVFINSTRSQIEVFKFDPATIADASITITARGLAYNGGDVEDAARKYPWTSNDTIVQLGTDAPQLFRDFVSESNTATITAQHTYDTLPESSVDPTDDDDFTRKAYVDGLTQPQIVTPVNQTAHGFVAGDVIRVSGVNQFAKAQADSATNAEVVGYVTEVTDVDNFKYATEGIITTGVPVFAAGTVLFLSRTVAGALTDTDTTTIGEVSLPLAVVNESGVRMTFHKYRAALINAISGNPVASETVAGSVEEATQAEVDSKASTGGTGAKLICIPSKMRSVLINDYVADTGAADAYVITPSPAITAYAAGQKFILKIGSGNTNTGAATLNVNGLGVKDIKKNGTAGLAAGDIIENQIIEVVYDGTQFQLVSPIIPSASTDVQEFLTSGTWTKPSVGSRVFVQAWGGGGAGGRSSSLSGGGGGGAYVEAWFDIDDLSSSETITIGAGGIGTTDNGGNGGNSTFGSLLTAYGGGGGAGLNRQGGGGGGGSKSAGQASQLDDGGDGGGPLPGVGATSSADATGSVAGGGGGGAENAHDPGDSHFGGGGGSGYSSAAGTSTYGGGGGGNPSITQGGASIFGGNGGAGSASTASAGAVPGGGGGGGRSGVGGAGGAGKIIVTVV